MPGKLYLADTWIDTPLKCLRVVCAKSLQCNLRSLPRNANVPDIVATRSGNH